MSDEMTNLRGVADHWRAEAVKNSERADKLLHSLTSRNAELAGVERERDTYSAEIEELTAEVMRLQAKLKKLEVFARNFRDPNFDDIWFEGAIQKVLNPQKKTNDEER